MRLTPVLCVALAALLVASIASADKPQTATADIQQLGASGISGTASFGQPTGRVHVQLSGLTPGLLRSVAPCWQHNVFCLPGRRQNPHGVHVQPSGEGQLQHYRRSKFVPGRQFYLDPAGQRGRGLWRDRRAVALLAPSVGVARARIPSSHPLSCLHARTSSPPTGAALV
jgi:hypothetical protein